MKVFKTISAVVFTLVTMISFSQATMYEPADKYPAAEKGMVKHIIYLPKNADNSDHSKKIEIFVGKYMETDKCNTYRLLGDFQTKEVTQRNWLSYYVFEGNGNAMSTLMACPDNTKQMTFVKSQKILLDYSGNLPYVVYAPEGMEVRYQIYTIDQQEYKALEVK